MAVPRHDDVKPWKRWIPVSSCRWRFICWFQVQGMDEPELWRPRGTEVPASRQEAELARSPLHTVAGLLAGWNLQLFVGHRPHPGDSAGGA